MSDDENKTHIAEDDGEEVINGGDEDEKDENVVEKSDSSGDEVEKAAADSTSPIKKASPVKKSSPKKVTPIKMASEEKEDEDSDEEDESGDDQGEEASLQPGLLERPVVLEKGVKRAKKKVQRLEIAASTSPRDKKVGIPEGRGIKLGDLPRIDFHMNRTVADDLKPLHRFLFGRPGTQFETKRNIRKFSGFSFSRGDKDFDKKVQNLSKFTIPMLKSVCEVLDLERGGTKDTLIVRVMDFLLDPKDSGKPLPKPKQRRSASGDKKKGVKRKRKSKKSEGDEPKTSKSTKKKKEPESDSDVESGSESDSEEEASDKESSDESEDEAPKKKPRAVTPKKKKVPTATLR